jgi:serine protease inhibitor
MAAVGAAIVTGCGSSSQSTGGEVHANLARAPAAFSPTDAAALAAGNATFAGRMLELLSSGQPTFAFSPFSISSALAMTYAGARAQTATQISGALDFRLAPNSLERAFNALGLSLATVNRPGATLAIANALYGQRDLAFRKAFLATLARYYGAGMRTVDFEHAAETARLEINAWVSQQTHGKIPHLLAPGQVNDLTRLALVNAVYLNAKWESPFLRSATAPAPFHAPSGTVNVPTMNQTSFFPYRRATGYSVLELPYRGGRLEFDVLLPDPGKLPGLLQKLRAGALPAAVSGLQSRHVELSLPKLQLRTQFQLSSALAALGMPVAFSDRADFSGIAGRPGELRISSVVHEAYIRVDEAGTEAAAATAVGIATSAAPGPGLIRFDVDRPFVFVLRDTATNAILFAGTVSRP